MRKAENAWGKLLAKYTQKLCPQCFDTTQQWNCFSVFPRCNQWVEQPIHCHKTTESEKQHMVLAFPILSTGNKQRHICCSLIIEAYGGLTVTPGSRKLKAKIPGRKPPSLAEKILLVQSSHWRQTRSQCRKMQLNIAKHHFAEVNHMGCYFKNSSKSDNYKNKEYKRSTLTAVIIKHAQPSHSLSIKNIVVKKKVLRQRSLTATV